MVKNFNFKSNTNSKCNFFLFIFQFSYKYDLTSKIWIVIYLITCVIYQVFEKSSLSRHTVFSYIISVNAIKLFIIEKFVLSTNTNNCKKNRNSCQVIQLFV